MAIDTAAKRRSAAAVLTGLLIVGVTPAASPDLAWRQSAGWGYEGIATLQEVTDTRFRSRKWAVYVPDHDDAWDVWVPSRSQSWAVYVPDHNDAWAVRAP